MELLLSTVRFQQESVNLHMIICSPFVNNEAVAILLEWRSLHLDENYCCWWYSGQCKLPPIEFKIRLQNPDSDVFRRLHGELSSSIIAYFDACQNDPQDPLCHSDTAETLSKIKAFFQGTGKAIQLRNSCVFMLCFQNIEDKSPHATAFVQFAIWWEAWYIMHLMLTDQALDNKSVLDSVWDGGCEQPLFISNYILSVCLSRFNRSSISERRDIVEKLKNQRLPIEFHGSSRDDPLVLWLICAYSIQMDQNALRNYNLCDLLFNSRNRGLRPSTRLLMVKLFIKFGIDVIRPSSQTKETPMSYAIDTSDMRLVRLLLYHNYDLSCDNAANWACLSNEFHLLKVLVLSGDRLTPKNEETFLDTPLSTYGFDPQDPLDRLRGREVTWLKDWLPQPHSLSFHCRKTIRELYKTDLPQLLQLIFYPKKLKMFLRTEIITL